MDERNTLSSATKSDGKESHIERRREGHREERELDHDNVAYEKKKNVHRNN
jgi:hypothetical protein